MRKKRIVIAMITRIIIVTYSVLQQFLSEKDLKRRRDGENKFEEIVRRMEALEEEVQFLKAENLKVHLCIIIIKNNNYNNDNN